MSDLFASVRAYESSGLGYLCSSELRCPLFGTSDTHIRALGVGRDCRKLVVHEVNDSELALTTLRSVNCVDLGQLRRLPTRLAK